MATHRRFPRIHHSTSQPYHFFGRTAELALLDRAVFEPEPSVIALVGPGGQGKTAIVQHWLGQFIRGEARADGVFLWSFYRGKDTDLCLRELYAYVADLAQLPQVSATYCVDRLVPLLRGGRWVVVLDGAEVVQHESGPWFGRFIHPELGRLLEALASAPQPGVLLLTTRFPLPELERRPSARVLMLSGLDRDSARGLLQSLGVRGTDAKLDAAAAACGHHAKAVELLGTYLVRFHQAKADDWGTLPHSAPLPGMSDEEHKVTSVLAAYQAALASESQDILALATAFRDPPPEARLLEYLKSGPVHALLHEHWGRAYSAFARRPLGWLAAQVKELVQLRLLERVGLAPPGAPTEETAVIDAHPLVRRAFEHVLGSAGRRQNAQARAGFLSGRPDRRRAVSLEEAREEVELFHAYCDAGLWQEADATLEGLEKPRYRFLAPASEKDLLLRFFPGGDWRQPPLWPRFGRFRSLAICQELLGSFEDALTAYREEDAPLRGDALIALGRLEPLLADRPPPYPWQMLWQAYRAHGLCLAGRVHEATDLAATLVPVDVYEWTHLFECLLRAGQLAVLDMRSFLYRPPHAAEHHWNDLARQRMRADYLRVTAPGRSAELEEGYQELLEAYDRGGLPYERTLTRLGYARWLMATADLEQAAAVNAVTLDVARRHGMRIMEADAWRIEAVVAQRHEQHERARLALESARMLRQDAGYHGPDRP